MEQAKVALIGLGGIGGAYVAQAKDHGFGIAVLCDEGRKKRYTESGFVVNGTTYQFDYVTEPREAIDLLLISVKQHHLRETIDFIRPFVSEKTILLSLLNGITSEDILRKSLSTENVVPAITVGTDSQKKDHIITYSSKGKIIFGHQKPAKESLVNRAEQVLSLTGIQIERVPNIEAIMWWKFMTNVGINQTAALLKVPYLAFQQEGPVKEIAKSAMREVIQIADQLNIPLSESDMDQTFALVNSVDGQNKSSTLQDIEARRETEVEIFAGEVMKKGKVLGIETPVNEVLYHSLKYFESAY